MPMKAFRAKEWIQGGIFSDVCRDDFVVSATVARGLYRQRVPSWDNAACAAPCEFRCPASIPTQLRYNLLRAGKVEEAYKLVLDYTPFPGSVCGGVCPNPCMEGCTRGGIDEAVQIGALGRCSIDVSLPRPTGPTGKKVAVIGGGVAGLSAAWRLARKGHEVTVYEADDRMGGKLEQVIPRARLPHEILEKELKRIEDMGVRFQAAAWLTRTGLATPAGKRCDDRRHWRHITRVEHEGLAAASAPWPGPSTRARTLVSAGMSSSSAAATLAWMPQPGPMRWARKA